MCMRYPMSWSVAGLRLCLILGCPPLNNFMYTCPHELECCGARTVRLIPRFIYSYELERCGARTVRLIPRFIYSYELERCASYLDWQPQNNLMYVHPVISWSVAGARAVRLILRLAAAEQFYVQSPPYELGRCRAKTVRLIQVGGRKLEHCDGKEGVPQS